MNMPLLETIVHHIQLFKYTIHIYPACLVDVNQIRPANQGLQQKGSLFSQIAFL